MASISVFPLSIAALTPSLIARQRLPQLIAVLNVAGLGHEALDHPVEDHAVIEALDHNSSLIVVQGAKDGCKFIEWIHHCAAHHSRVEIMRGAMQGHVEIHQSAECRCDRWGIGIPHADAFVPGPLACRL